MAAFVASHLAMEVLARKVELQPGVFLWWREEFLQFLSPANYVGRGDGRLVLYGPSEAREALVAPVFEERLPGLEAYQNSQTVAIFDDALVLFEYISRTYGEGADPDALLFGITPRFVANMRFWEDRSPIYFAIDQYSPAFDVDQDSAPARLVPKSRWRSYRARFAFRCRQQRRYQSALLGTVREAIRSKYPELARDPDVWYMLTPHKYHHLARMDSGTERFLDNPNNPNQLLFHWQPEQDAATIRDRIERLKRFTGEHDIDLYVVNLPEHPLMQARYDPGVYDTYLRIVKEALGDTPFLDLRTFVGRSGFYDYCHTTREAAIRVSGRIADFVAQRRADRDAS